MIVKPSKNDAVRQPEKRMTEILNIGKIDVNINKPQQRLTVINLDSEKKKSVKLDNNRPELLAAISGIANMNKGLQGALASTDATKINSNDVNISVSSNHSRKPSNKSVSSISLNNEIKRGAEKLKSNKLPNANDLKLSLEKSLNSTNEESFNSVVQKVTLSEIVNKSIKDTNRINKKKLSDKGNTAYAFDKSGVTLKKLINTAKVKLFLNFKRNE
jgi:hypothetical protein